MLRKPDDSRYDHSKTYEIVDPGKWTVKKSRDSVEFTHVLTDSASGYGYVYKKTVRLIKDKPEMALEHSLKNTGTQPIKSTVYDHNFPDWTSGLQGRTIPLLFRSGSNRRGLPIRNLRKSAVTSWRI